MKSNKQFIAAVAFFVFIAVALVGLLVYNGNDNNDDNKEVATTEEKVKDAKTVKVITSNSNITSDSNSNNSNSNISTSNSNSTSNKSNNSKNSYIPISYFITELIEDKIYVGNKTRVNVDIKPNNATTKEVTYKSQDTSVATVDSNGVITGVSPGICYIDINVKDVGGARVEIQVLKRPTISNSNSKNNSSSNTNSNSKSNSSSNSKSNSSSNTNSNSRSNSSSNSNKTINVTSVSLNQTKLSLKTSKQATLTATILPSNASNKSVTWTTTNPSVATVSGGVVTAKGAGTATISAITKDGGKKATCTVTVSAPKNGWVTENGKKYYYVNDVKQTNKYVDYIYLDSNGVAQSKLGSFSVTIYGAQGWVSADVYIRKEANANSTGLGLIKESNRVTILDTDYNGFIKVKYNNIIGYIPTNYLFINLPDVMPYVVYEISNANKSIFKVADMNIPNVTGKNLYAYSAKYNSKIGKTTYYAPLLYPVAKKFQNAFNSAWKSGYTFKVYDTYRPRPVEELVSKNYSSLYYNNASVKKAVDYDKNGGYWGWGWFMTTTGTSRHCQGIALDLALANKNGTELKAQTAMHTLDTRSLRKYNNNNANLLSGFMTGAGFSTLQSEWWHYEDNTYKNNAYETFYIK